VRGAKVEVRVEVEVEESSMNGLTSISRLKEQGAEPLDAGSVRHHMTVSTRFMAKLQQTKDALSHSHPDAGTEEIHSPHRGAGSEAARYRDGGSSPAGRDGREHRPRTVMAALARTPTL
jgi:hypothetical protein